MRLRRPIRIENSHNAAANSQALEACIYWRWPNTVPTSAFHPAKLAYPGRSAALGTSQPDSVYETQPAIRMASATAATALPRSRTNATASVTSNEAVVAIEQWRAPEDPDFTHPDHVVPAPRYPNAENLIIVCCHAIFLPDADDSDFPLHSPHHEPNWALAPFQKSDRGTGKPGEHETFLAHAKAGLDALCIGTDAEHPPNSLLVFSGGATQRSRTQKSEARSYYHAALAEELAAGHLYGGRTHTLYHKGYILLEEHATDSFQNLLFSIVRFRVATGKYPKQIRVITHAFKAKRFLDLHAPAIDWPKNRIQAQGLDPVMSATELESAIRGEAQHGYAPWKDDPFGRGDLLSSKRAQRGWNEGMVAEFEEGLEDEVKELLRGSRPARLPWLAIDTTS
ncbi:hypothetical protein ACN47E_002167 [Coniothyrium glycines]